MAHTTGQEAGELNGHAKLNGDFNHHTKPRPNSAHAGMLKTTPSSSSDLLTPTPGAPLDTNVPLSADFPSSGMTSQTMISSPLSTVTTPEDHGDIGAGSNWKKATRKLSLTGTMLGFTKKEKYKDKLGGIQ